MKTGVMLVALAGALAFTAGSPVVIAAKAPESAGQHSALAQRYHAQAARYRNDEARHLKVVDEYWYSSSNSNLRARGRTNPQVEKIVSRESDLAAQAADRAAEAEAQARFHELRSKELRGS